MTDHMLEADWQIDAGWSAPVIKPYEDLRLSPAALCLHYALEVSTHPTYLALPPYRQCLTGEGKCFEGMKAYKDAQGRTRLFRPLDNMRRMNASAERLSLPVSPFPSLPRGRAITHCTAW